MTDLTRKERADAYRKRAERVELDAKNANYTEATASYLSSARGWRKLADEVESLL